MAISKKDWDNLVNVIAENEKKEGISNVQFVVHINDMMGGFNIYCDSVSVGLHGKGEKFTESAIHVGICVKEVLAKMIEQAELEEPPQKETIN